MAFNIRELSLVEIWDCVSFGTGELVLVDLGNE